MKIFLSYSSTDRDLADRIRLALVAQKHNASSTERTSIRATSMTPVSLTSSSTQTCSSS
jgi:hypothetical protein